MILRTIRVEGWRCFAAAAEVGPFADGLNIIHGPNGIGKSTLMTALTRGLFDNHNVGGADIKSLRPWGRALAPKVTIEFEQDGEQFRISKQFLTSDSSRLDRKENGQYVPLAESRAADEKARGLLAGEAPARGASDQRHWGLAQILWASQGSLPIEQLAPGTRATIQDALGAEIAGPGTEALEARIANAYGQYFTATGKLKSGASAPAVVGLQSQLETAREKQQMLQRRLDEFESASRLIEDLRGKTESARHSEHDLNERLKQMRQQVQKYQQLAGQQELHQKDVDAAETSYRHLDERIESIRGANDERDEANRQLKGLLDNAPAQDRLVSRCKEEARLAEQKVQEIRGRRREVTEAQNLAKLADRYVATRSALDALDKQIKKIETAEAEVQQLRQSRDKVVAPDKKTLKHIIEVARKRDDSRLQLDASSITVSIQAEIDTQVDVISGEEAGTRSFAKDATEDIKGSPEVIFRIPGVGQFRATGPTGDFDELREQWEAAVARFDELTSGYGTTDITLLEKRRAEAEALEQRIAQADQKIQTLLDGKSIDHLRRDRAQAANRLDEILSTQPDWKDSPPDPVLISRQAEDTATEFTRDIERAELAQDDARKALQNGLEQQSANQSQIAGLEAQLASVESRLEALRNDKLDDKQRAEQLRKIAMERDAAEGKLEEVAEKIRELGDDPSKALEVLEGQLDAVRRDASDAEQKLHQKSGQLEQIIAEAPYSALAAAEEDADRLEAEIARQQLQIDAIRLLHETLTHQKREVMHSVLGPIRLRAQHILQRIAGTRFDEVHFDDSLLPSGISPRSVDDTVSLDQISGGEREQVYFAVRMALADVACRDQRQLVVLDDVFTYTDTSRLARIATILDEAAERFQIVLLTCHPERYRGLQAATFFDLEKIIAGTQR